MHLTNIHPKMHHFVTEMCTYVHISVTKWCIVGYEIDASWDLCHESIENFSRESNLMACYRHQCAASNCTGDVSLETQRDIFNHPWNNWQWLLKVISICYFAHLMSHQQTSDEFSALMRNIGYIPQITQKWRPKMTSLYMHTSSLHSDINQHLVN